MKFPNLFDQKLIIVLVSFCLTDVSGYKYLFQSYSGEGSHFLASAYLGEALVKRGHEVTFLISSISSYRTSDPRWGPIFDYIVYDNPHPDNAFKRTTDEFVNASFQHGITSGLLYFMVLLLDPMVLDCEKLLLDQNLINKLIAKQYDILVFDGGWLCNHYLAIILKLRKIMFNPTGYHPGAASLAGSPVNLAYIPTQLEPQSTLPLSFFERVQNMWFFVYSQGTMLRAMMPPYTELQERLNISKQLGVIDIVKNGLELVLINMDAEIDLTVPLTPNVIAVGGLTAEPGNPLPEDLEIFVNSAGQDGVVVFSLGSYVATLPKWLIGEIIQGFSSVPYQILWKFDNPDGFDLPPNVMTKSWLPLNDLLGHRQTRAFVFHGGNNGFYEAIYHGVPMVILPIMGDQAQVAKRATRRGIGIELNIRTLTANELRDAIIDIMTNASIKRNMIHFRDIHHHKPMNATARAAYWIEHVTKFGGSSYEPKIDHLGFLQYALIDVTIVLFLAALILTCVFIKLILFCCRCIRRCCNI